MEPTTAPLRAIYSRAAVASRAAAIATGTSPLSRKDYRWLRGQLTRPDQKDVLQAMQQAGKLPALIPAFGEMQALRPWEVSHTFGVCEATEHFMSQDFPWFYKRLKGENISFAAYQKLLRPFHDQWLTLSREERAAFPMIALLHDIGKAVDPAHFHAEASGILAERLLAGSYISRSFAYFAAEVVRHHLLIGGLVTREFTPATVLSYLHTLTNIKSDLRRVFNALFIFILLDVSGADGTLTPFVISRFQKLSSLEAVEELKPDFFNVRLGTLCRTFDEVKLRLGKTQSFPEVLSEIERTVLKAEQPLFVSSIKDDINFYGLIRTMFQLGVQAQVRLLRLLVHLKLAQEAACPASAGRPFSVILSDPMKKEYLQPDSDLRRRYVEQINGLLGNIPEACVLGDVQRELAQNNFASAFGFPVAFDPDSVLIDFS